MKNKIILYFLMSILFSFIVNANMIDEADQVAAEIEEFVDDDSVIVIGDHLSKTERWALAFVKERYLEIRNTKQIKEEDYFKDNYSGVTVAFLGGPQQNSLSKLYLDTLEVTEKNEYSFGYVIYLKDEQGNKFMVFSDKAGFGNTPRDLSKSPLAKVIPEKYIPAVVTVVGFSLLWLWQFLFRIFNRIFRSVGSSKILKLVKKKKMALHFKGFRVFGIRIKYREWFSIVGAAIIFAIAIATSFYAENWLDLILVAVIVNVIIYFIRHFTRLIMDKMHDHHTEYVFWWWGALVTVCTGWLGNTFSLSGYTIKEKDTDHKAKIAYVIDILTFLFAVVFVIWNFIAPTIIIQMAMLMSMSIAVIQMLPVEPFNGKIVYNWKKWLWWISFIPMLAVYIVVNVIV